MLPLESFSSAALDNVDVDWSLGLGVVGVAAPVVCAAAARGFASQVPGERVLVGHALEFKVARSEPAYARGP